MSSIDVDRSEWPIVVYRFEGGATDEITRRYVEAVEENLHLAAARNQQYVSIVVADSLSTSAANRRAIASSIEGHAERIAKACAGNALVTTSAVSRGLLTALCWMITMPVPVEVFATLEQAKTWASSRLGRQASSESA